MRRLISIPLATALLFFASFGIAATAFASPAVPTASKQVRVCADTPAGYAHCLAIQNVLTTTANVSPHASSPQGYNPVDLRSAYNLPSTTGGLGQTVAIVDAYNDPNTESDLAVYRAQFGLSACTTANGCFRKVNQTGGTKYPRGNVGWAEEISLDLDMVSAICPNCHILLVEASSASFTNLATAVNTAVSLGANAVSNSYGGSEFSTETSLASSYNHPGTIITASSGDKRASPLPLLPACTLWRGTRAAPMLHPPSTATRAV